MTDRESTNLMTPLGAPGLQHWGGYIHEEWDKRLRTQRQKMATYREMAEGSATIGALLYMIEAIVIGAGHRFEKADDSPAALEAMDFAESCIGDMQGAFNNTLSEMCTAFVFGFSLSELVYKRRLGTNPNPRLSSAFDDGKIGWERWAPRSQESIERWIFDDETGDVLAAVQNAPPRFKMVEIPMDRLLHIAIRARKQSPEGTSLIRNAFESWYYFKHLQRIEAIGIERDMAGLPVLWIPAADYADDAKRNAWLQVGRELRVDEAGALVMPMVLDPTTKAKMYDVSLLSTGGQRAIDTDKVLGRYERLILRSVLADFVTLGDQGVGSFALGATRSDLFIGALRGFMDAISDAITDQAVRRLMLINGMDPALTPTFRLNDPSAPDAAAFATTLATLAGIGAVDVETPEMREHVYDLLDLPKPKDGFDAIDVATKPVPEPDPTANPADPTADPKNPVPPQFQASETGLDGKLTDGALERARAAFDAVVGDRFQGLLEAEVTA